MIHDKTHRVDLCKITSALNGTIAKLTIISHAISTFIFSSISQLSCVGLSGKVRKLILSNFCYVVTHNKQQNSFQTITNTKPRN